MDGRRKRGTIRHKGVVLCSRVLPSGATSWRARYKDPDTGLMKRETLPADLTTEEERARWAMTKCAELKRRGEELEAGAPVKTGTPLDQAIERYFTACEARLGEKTVIVCRRATTVFLEWAKTRGLHLADDVRAHHLAAFRDYFANLPALRQQKKRPKNNAFVPSGDVRKPGSVNRELGALKAVLEHLRRLGLVAMLQTKDSIRESLKSFPLPKPTPEHLVPEDLVLLIQAAARHDRECYALTREEKAAGLKKGSTPCYEPILPYLATVLLTGMRADEARQLLWARVNLRAHPAGVISLRPEEVKTRQGRIVDLVVSPGLCTLLARHQLSTGGGGFVFGGAEPVTRGILESARRRLRRDYGAPVFTWQQLRVTCGTFLANAGGIFGAASAYREAKQLGHSVVVAERHYLGVVHVDREATTLEAAMGIERALHVALGLPTKRKRKTATG